MVSKIGSDFLINTITTGDQGDSQITKLPGGGFVVVWADSSQLGEDAETDIRGQVFAADGSPAGGEFLINTVTDDEQTLPTIATLSNGNFIVAWSDENQSLDRDDNAEVDGILAQVFAPDGTKVGGEFVVNNDGGLYDFSSSAAPSITALSGGRFAVAWPDGNIALRIFDGPDAPAAEQFQVNNQLARNIVSITTLSDGNVLVVWPNGSGDQMLGRIFDDEGAEVVSYFEVATGADPNSGALEPKITALDNGGFVAIWPVADGPAYDWFARTFNANGTPSGAAFQIDSTGKADTDASVAALAGGRFVVVWRDPTIEPDSGAFGQNGIAGQVYEADGTPFGERFLVNPPGFETEQNPAVTALTARKFVVSWSGSGVSGSDVHGQILAVGDLVMGDEDPNTLVGTKYGDIIIGKGADDLLKGLKDADQLEGNGGNDTLKGGAGDDELKGGAGNDALSGASGDDALRGNKGDDTLNGGRGEDALDGDRGGDVLNGGAADDVLDGGGGNDELNGDDGNDTLKGGKANDTLNGGRGNDVLAGGKGNDRYVFSEAPGNGVDTITKFQAVEKIKLDHDAFGGIGSSGTLKGKYFVEADSAQDANDRIIYDKAAGKLYYDQDGDGPDGQVLFAKVDPGTSLDRSDFVVF